MNQVQQDAYDEGYRAFQLGNDESTNPYETGYTDALGEYWSDGFEDAYDDEAQR